MKEVLEIACIQADIAWEQPEANRNHYETYFQQLDKNTDVVVLPEMFTTGFSMNPSANAEPMFGTTMHWMETHATALDALILGSLIIEEEGQYYNRLIAMYPNGTVRYYDKRHLFTLAGEHLEYTKGEERLELNFRGWKICPLICYDLRFPVWSRNTQNFDVLLYVANWPAKRLQAWDVLLKARAIENMCYTIGVNRVGADANNLDYVGHTQVIDALGTAIATTKEGAQALLQYSLSKPSLNKVKSALQFLNDRDFFTIE
ncbi:nitrilase family protein [Urechidicola sp. KH5]